MTNSDLSLFSVFWSERDKARIMVYEACPYSEGDTLMIQGRVCRVDNRRSVSYQEHTCILSVTVMDYIGP